MPHKHFIHARPSSNKGEYVAEIKEGDKVIAKAFGASREQATRKALDKIPRSHNRFKIDVGDLPNTYIGSYFEVTDTETGEVQLASCNDDVTAERNFDAARRAVEKTLPPAYFQQNDIRQYGGLRTWRHYHPYITFVLPVMILSIIIIIIIGIAK